MKKYKNDIKGEILLAAGTTIGKYEEVSIKDVYGYDPVDRLIISSSKELKRSHKQVFILLYECHSLQKAIKRLKKRYEIVPDSEQSIAEQSISEQSISEQSILRYMRDSKKLIIELFHKNEEELEKLRNELNGNDIHGNEINGNE